MLITKETNLRVINNRRQICGECENFVEYGGEKMTVTCRARSEPNLWADLDAIEQEDGCPRSDKWHRWPVPDGYQPIPELTPVFQTQTSSPWEELFLYIFAGNFSDGPTWVERFAFGLGKERERQFRNLLKTIKPDYTSVETMFTWAWSLKNANNRLLKKPEMTRDEAWEYWRQRLMKLPAVAVPTSPTFPLKLHGPEWKANFKACRACKYYRNGALEMCGHDGGECGKKVFTGDCPIGLHPYSKNKKLAPDAVTSQKPAAPPAFGSNVGKRRPGGTPAAEPVDFPIDLVYLWVDSSDPVWRAEYKKHVRGDPASGTRFTNADELRYSLRSVDRFAPWINHIFIVTMGQTPEWLITSNPKISIVDHKSIIDAQYLPTFNSQAIECHIGRIPGLAEHFLYANDDMFFGAPVQPGHFFTRDGKAKMHLAGKVRDPGDGSYAKMKSCAADLLDGLFGAKDWRRGWHQIKSYRKAMFDDLEQRIPQAMADCASHKTRGSADPAWNCGLWPAFSIEAGYAVDAGKSIEAGYIEAGERDRGQMQKFINSMPHVFCVNNSNTGSAELVKEFLRAYFPARSGFEFQDFTVGAKLGDLIYALSSVKYLGGGRLHYKSVKHFYRAEKMLALISPLVKLQSYILDFKETDYIIGRDLEDWGGGARKKRKTDRLASIYARAGGAEKNDFSTPWIDPGPADRRARVIISRTARYHNASFPWRKVLDRYGGEIAFVGLPEEHRDFERFFGSVPYLPTKDFLELARVIKGADLFIGNQSSAYALAEAMKVNTVQEVCVQTPDCIFDRPNAVYIRDESGLLPNSFPPSTTSPFFAQHGEDKWIRDNWARIGLPEKGIFVEVGVGDGKSLSNTLWLEQNGWSGVLVEPDHRRFEAIRNCRLAKLVTCAAGKSEGSTTFTLTSNPDLSGILRTQGESVEVSVRTLSSILDAEGVKHVDVLSIDTEGTELDVWEGFDCGKFRPIVVFVEWNTVGLRNRTDEIVNRMKASNYRLETKIGGNLVFTQKMPSQPVVNALWTATTNIGDHQSAVLNHIPWPGRIQSFNVDTSNLASRVIILGGGGVFHSPWDGLLQRIVNSKPARLIGWGIGTNNIGSTEAWYPSCADAFDLLGVRDDQQKWPWVPCVSCLSPLFDQKQTARHPVVIYKHSDRSLHAGIDAPTMSNNATSFAEVIAFLGSGECVVTDSYHGAYWATLLGRRVIVADAWGNKFRFMRHQPAILTTTMADAESRAIVYPHALEECRDATNDFRSRVISLIS